MLLVEQKLSEWRAIYTRINEVQTRFQQAVRAGEFEKVEACTRELAELNDGSAKAMKCLHKAVEAAKNRL